MSINLANNASNSQDKFVKTGSANAVKPHTLAEMEQIFAKPTKISLDEKRRAELLLQANKIFNEGKLEKARTVFSMLGYYDGMVRAAKQYYKSGQVLESFATFKHAGATKETKEVAKQIAQSIKDLLNN